MKIAKNKKIEVQKPEDIKKLPSQEQLKWELALELGLFDKIVSGGWKCLTARESGKIGGIISSRRPTAKAAQPETTGSSNVCAEFDQNKKRNPKL